jgi:molybdate transport system ATP-binding protein
MIPLIRLDGVDVAIEGVTILREVRWCLREGEHWAVLGGNGSGKSTFLKLIRGELAPAPGGMGRRVYGFDGDEQVTAVGVKEKVALVSPELQTRYLTQEWALSVRAVIHSGITSSEYSPLRLRAEQKERADQIVELLGIDALLPRSVQALSTGELRKVLIARALAGAPRVLVCDEVCDGLDAASRANLLSALDRVARNGTQLLLTTHRSEELIPAITHRAVFQGGRMVEVGPLLPSLRFASEPAKGSELPRLKRRSVVRDGKFVDAKILIQIERADVFLNERRVLRNINLEIKTGEHWAVLGPNGAGKSTLLKLIMGDLHPAWGGRVRRFEFTPRNTIWELRRRIGYVSPELQSNYRDDVTGAQAIATGFTSSIGVMLKPDRKQMAASGRLAEELGIGHLAGKSVLQMSYGEFRRVLIARALVHRPQLLVCDEPFDGLDATGREEIGALLERVAASGANLVVVTHHADDLPGCLTHCLELKAGRVIFQGEMEKRR